MKRIAPGFYSETTLTTANGKTVEVEIDLWKVEGQDEWAYSITDKQNPSTVYAKDIDWLPSKKEAVSDWQNLIVHGFYYHAEHGLGWCSNPINKEVA